MQKMINTLTWHAALEAPSLASTATRLLTLIAKSGGRRGGGQTIDSSH